MDCLAFGLYKQTGVTFFKLQRISHSHSHAFSDDDNDSKCVGFCDSWAALIRITHTPTAAARMDYVPTS
jgi:hypothetical protein